MSIFHPILMTHVYDISIAEMERMLLKDPSKSVRDIIQDLVRLELEDTCVRDGYVQKGSLKVQTFNSTLRDDRFHVTLTLSCNTFMPTIGQELLCVVRDITRMGIRCESIDETPTPFQAILLREYLYANTSGMHHHSQTKKEADKRNEIMDNIIIGQQLVIYVMEFTNQLRGKFVHIVGEPVPHIIGEPA